MNIATHIADTHRRRKGSQQYIYYNESLCGGSKGWIRAAVTLQVRH